MTIDRKFPCLSDTLQGPAALAAKLGLTMTHYSSGTQRHPDNGTRLFLATAGRCADHFQNDHVAHLTSLAEVNAFLAGYQLASRSA